MITVAAKAKISDEEALQRFEEGIEPDPATRRGPEATADIRATARMRDLSQQMLDEAVIEARYCGITWLEIAIALDVSPQAVRQKYRDRV